MKVLMVSNSIPASVAKKINRDMSASGGWVEAMAQQLNNVPNMDIVIVHLSYSILFHNWVYLLHYQK